MKDEELECITPVIDQKLDAETQLQIKRLQRNCAVELSNVQEFHDWLDDHRQCRQSCRVVGESQTGKTFACSMYRSKNAPTQSNGDVLMVPVIYWQATTNTSLREMFDGLLGQLQYRVKIVRVFDLRAQVYWLLKVCQVEMIIIDEAERMRAQTLSEIQDISDKFDIAVVLVGPTTRLNTVLERDEQVDRRFIPCYQFRRFDSYSLENITAIWEKYVLRLPQPSNLTSFQMQKILAASTGGYLGLLDMILRSAARRALQNGKSRIDITLLKQVVSEHV
jgi:DNA transposition AAA+ family ATPase